MSLNVSSLPKTFTNLLVWSLLFVGGSLFGLAFLLSDGVEYNVYQVLDLSIHKLAIVSLVVGLQLVLIGVVDAQLRNYIAAKSTNKQMLCVAAIITLLSEVFSFAFLPNLPPLAASSLSVTTVAVLYVSHWIPQAKLNRNLLLLLFLGVTNTVVVFWTHEHRNEDQHLHYAVELAERKDTLAEIALARLVEQYSNQEIPLDGHSFWESKLLSDPYLASNYQFHISVSPLNADPLATLVTKFFISSDQHPTYSLSTPDSHTLTLKLKKDFRHSVYLQEQPYKLLDDLDKYSFTVVDAGQIILSNTHDFDSEILNIPLPEIGETKKLEHKGFDVSVYRNGAESFVLIGEPLSESQVVISNFAFFFSIALVLLILFEALQALRKNIYRAQYWESLALEARIKSILVGFTLTLFVVISATTFVFLVNNNYETSKQTQLSAAKTLKQGLEWTTKFGQLPLTSIGRGLLRDKADSKGAEIDLYSSEGVLIRSSIASLKNSPAQLEVDEHVRSTLAANPAAMLIERYMTPSGKVILTYFGLTKGRSLAGIVRTAKYEKDVQATYDIPVIMSNLLNVYVGLLLLSWAIGLILVDMLNRPLKLLSSRLSSFELGTKTEPLTWQGEGVIGTLIDAHNQMVAKVEATSQELIATERESAWQVMALQIAHEINNTLTPLRLNTQYINASLEREQIESLDGARRMGERMVERIDYLSKVATQFQLFANLEKPEGTAVDVQLLVRTFLAKNTFEFPVTTECNVDHQYTCETQVETAHIEHVLENLLIYAQAKVDKVDGFPITIATSNGDSHVCLTIKFQTNLLSEDEQASLFDPTFSSLGSESGLALPICHRIVTFYEGTLVYEQMLDQEALFLIRLPSISLKPTAENASVLQA